MPDTVRTVATLQALLADNATGDISPQDLRDFLVSVPNPYGAISRNVAAATTIVTPGTYYKAAGTTTIGNASNFDMPVDGRLRYTGTTQRHFHIAITVALTTANVNNVVGLKIAKNGTVIDNTVTKRFVSTGADIGSTALHGDVSMVQNDYLELFVTNETDTDTVTIEELYLFAMGMLV